MTEDDLLIGITHAMSIGGWLYTHTRRSDLARNMGIPGVPDVWAVHPERGTLLVLELKSETGTYRPGQQEWLAALRTAGVDARTVRPPDYDALIEELLGDRLLAKRGTHEEARK